MYPAALPHQRKSTAPIQYLTSDFKVTLRGKKENAKRQSCKFIPWASLKSNMISPDTEQLTINASKSKQYSTHLLKHLDSCKLSFWGKKNHTQLNRKIRNIFGDIKNWKIGGDLLYIV